MGLASVVFTVAAPADVEGVDADGVAGGHVGVVAGVVEDEGEDAVQHVDEVLAVLLIQRDDDLAVAAGGEGVLPGELLPDLLVVVDLSIGLFSFLINGDTVQKTIWRR
jgi:hypothetical protein